jgi:hypothetical protein
MEINQVEELKAPFYLYVKRFPKSLNIWKFIDFFSKGQAALHSRHLEYLREVLPKYNHLKRFESTWMTQKADGLHFFA